MEARGDIALIGLAVMGQNLILNMSDHGYTVVAYNRTVSKVDEFLQGAARGRTMILGAHSMEEMVRLLKRPRKVMLMVKAGKAVDDFIELVLPHLEPGDLIIDGGNSHFPDTIRRTKYLESKGLLYIGTGVSGGEEGARFGPSIMPGGSPEAWPLVKDIFQSISAKTPDGSPCCDWVGENGAGHYVKMTHNGIEYGDMQLICEAYQLMKEGLGMTPGKMHKVFAEWNKGELDSYLIEITRDILAYKDEDGEPLVEKILDTAGQKGTGKWTSQAAMDFGTPIPTIDSAVTMRQISSQKALRSELAAKYGGIRATADLSRSKINIRDVEDALFCAFVLTYSQGMSLLAAASDEKGYGLELSAIARIWRGGCIIRSRLLEDIRSAYSSYPTLKNLLLDPKIAEILNSRSATLRKTVVTFIENGIPAACFSSALAYFDAIRTERLPANLIQAQRDFFGAHTYQRTDMEGTFHTEW